MANHSMKDALAAWSQFESQYRMVRDGVDGFVADAAIIGLQMIQDVPTRTEYMKMIRAEADEMLSAARKNRSAIRDIFNRIYERRKELRLIAQDKAKATVAVLSKLMTKDPSKYQLLVRAADDLARKGMLPGVGTGKNIKSLPLERLSKENLDDVFLHAIDRAGGSRKSITPMSMKMRGAGLLLLTVALAGVDIYLAKDKSFAATKNVSTIAGGAGGAWAFAAAGLVVGGPVGGLVGLIVGGIVGSYVAEEAHFQIRGLHSDPSVDMLVDQYHGIVNFDEEGLGWALHREFLADLALVVIAFSHLNEKRNTDADDVARAYIDVARTVARNYPKGAFVDGLRSPMGRILLDLLYSILDSGWTTGLERSQMDWVQTMRRSVPAR